jgi:hypothetical protein
MTACLLAICFRRFYFFSTTLKMDTADSSKSSMTNQHLVLSQQTALIHLSVYVTTLSIFQNTRCLILWPMMNNGARLLFGSINIKTYWTIIVHGLTRWPCGLRRMSADARLLRLEVRILLRAWILLCCVGSGLCDDDHQVERSPTERVCACVYMCSRILGSEVA